MFREREAGPTGFRRPWAFWLGVTAVTGGVGLHVSMFLSAKNNHDMLAGMPSDGWMIAGTALLLVGYASVLRDLAPGFPRGRSDDPSRLEFDAMDETRLRPAHLKRMAVLTLALAVHTQKPLTLPVRRSSAA